MNIIEREIEKRQAIIDGKEVKIAELAELKEKVQKLEVEVASVETDVLLSEIEELKTYLPQPETVEVVENVEQSY